ncbi:MAG: PorV/PorQ family protein [Elusimicrobia bacterium]|nr:PorV/PorQ family protein [Elusimicrobiota bacterium]
MEEMRYQQIKSKISIKNLSLLCFLFSSLIPHPSSLVFADKIHPDAGTTSAAFLKIGAGARAVAMAGAFTSVSCDPYSIYWNPAGLACVPEKNLGFTHNDYFEGLKQEFLVYTLPGERMKFLKYKSLKSGVWGFGLNYFYTPKDIERRSGLYETDPLAPISPVEGKFRAYDLAFSMSYAYQVKPELFAGASLKYINQTIDDESGASFALDMGAIKNFIWLNRNFSAGFAAQNIGPGIKFISKRYKLPLNFKAGISHRIPGKETLLSLDITKPIDNYPFLAAGIEQSLSDKLVLRMGYKYRMHGLELGAWSGFAAGLGLYYKKLQFDYAFTPFGELGNSHRFGITFKFGKEVITIQPVSASEIVLAKHEVKGSRDIYTINARPVALSSFGITYEINAKSADSDLSRVSFKALTRGEPDISVSVASGELPADLSKSLPDGAKIYKAFRFSSNTPNIQGDIQQEFRVLKTWLESTLFDGKNLFVFYLSASGWESAQGALTGEDENYKYFKTNVGQSTHYAIGIK